MNPQSKYVPLLIACLFSVFGFSQVPVSGIVMDKTGEALPGATVKVLGSDSSFITGVSSDAEGIFTLNLQPDKRYIFVFSYLSYRDKYRNIELKNQAIDLGKINLREDATTLSEVEIKTLQQRGEQKGDTTSFNAGAFKTNPDATAEDLVKKMPGVTSDNTGVKVNGENVQKILVDGKPFFGDDPNAALKNLPAEIIDKVEVFDKMSDQAQFTGFSDGEQQKTINIVTKKGKNVGQFGKVYGGLGADEAGNGRYNGGAALNSFKNNQRLSLLLLSNNINQQNFSIDDITGSLGNTGQNSSRGGGGSRGGGRQGGSSTLLTSPQEGNTTTQSAGLNYSDTWGKKINVSGSYFFNYTDNKNASNITRTYFTNDQALYKQTNDDRKLNQNHRLNFRFEYTIDSSNKLTIVPRLNFQQNNATGFLLGSNIISDDISADTRTNSKSLNLGYDFSNSILFQHKFKKAGRTLSANLNTQLEERDTDGSYYSLNVFEDSTASLDQQYTTYSYNKRVSVNLSYTEPVSKYAQVQVSYIPSYAEGKSDKTTHDYDTGENEYTGFNTILSNKYNNVYQTQRGGLSYKYRKDKLFFGFGADAQQATLSGNQTFPTAFELNQSFRNILPNGMLNYRFDKTKNLRIFYRSSTNIPSLSQLQNVIDISNPLQIRSGNDRLKQTFENNLNIRFGGFNPKSSRNAMIFINANYTDSYISNATYILRADTVIQGYGVTAGSQLTKPVNLNGFYSARAFFVYGFPVKPLKSNLNFNGGVNYNHTPTLIDDLLNFSNSYATSGGIYIGSNVSQNLDFSLGYTGNYTVVKNSVQKRSDNSYFTHTAALKLNWIFFKGFVINTDLSHTMYNGLSQSFNQDYLLWNAYIGYKFFKNKSLEAKVSVFDILNQNRSINRTVTGAYTEDTYTSVLRRYAMFTLTYTLRNFKNGTPPKTDEQSDLFPGGRPPGMRPPEHR